MMVVMGDEDEEKESIVRVVSVFQNMINFVDKLINIDNKFNNAGNSCKRDGTGLFMLFLITAVGTV